MRRSLILVIQLLGMAFCATCGLGQEAAARAAYVPEPVREAGWLRRVAEQQGLLANQPCRVCFVGDSLTEFWLHTGRAAWDLEFVPLKAINLGLAADRTENILNRLHRLEFRRANPKLIVLMMGTNNLGMQKPDKPEDVLRAIVTAVTLLRTRLPQAAILLLTIPPSGEEPNSPLRQRIRETNSLMGATKWPERVHLLSVYEKLVDAEDRWREGYTLDGTHFSETGYARMAEILSPVVREMLVETETPSR